MKDCHRATLGRALHKIGDQVGKGFKAEDASNTPFRLVLMGRIGLTQLPTEGWLFDGNVNVGGPSAQISSSTPTGPLLAYLFTLLPKTKQKLLLEHPPTAQDLAALTEEQLQRGTAIASRVAVTKTLTKAAPVSVSFTEAPELPPAPKKATK